MPQFTIHQAKTHLSRLIRQAIAGEEVIIARGSTPLVRIQPLPSVAPERLIGGARGVVIAIADDLDEPLDDFREYAE